MGLTVLVGFVVAVLAATGERLLLTTASGSTMFLTEPG
ncbi:hypothetical protein HISP_17701 (plasmid) [Haloarcula hispanica N601]|uniref:Uncharacterized protein n=2 Tax=Haloarcula hispanica TaxID=51589 RepID=W0GDT3_HALHI|nr:hypothetical protein HAH_4217 [Haloarcula hispanica ATCC 33960]AHF55887.1 hypothetical protein HISP_17701 [Haloarcula hispanica N601]